jgi:hypothetical protein
LSSYPDRWLTFVANRVMEILTLIPRHLWHHHHFTEAPP